MLWKLLRQHISKAQLAGFFLANLCGMVIVLLGVQFYRDVLPMFTQPDSFMKKDYIVVSKQVSTLGSLLGGNGGFTQADIDHFSRQPFTKRVGAFRPARFRVSAGMGVQGMQLSTAMFFESVPDAFVDARTEGWRFRAGDEVIPIIIPRNYLDLYNFGFAGSRSLPQLSESMMGLITLDVRLSGGGQTRMLKGRIVGFSNRLNTILVPETFMDWANAELGDGPEVAPSRLIVEVDNPADDRIVRYCKENGYRVEQDKLDAGRTVWFLKLVVSIVLAIGLVISVLSFYLLMLSIYLLLQKNTHKLETLLLIGYSPARVALPYQLLTIGLNTAVLLLSIFIVLGVRSLYTSWLSDIYVGSGLGVGIWAMLSVGVLLLLLVSVLNVWAVRRKLESVWRKS